jgi:hypothetical protein
MTVSDVVTSVCSLHVPPVPTPSGDLISLNMKSPRNEPEAPLWEARPNGRFVLKHPPSVSICWRGDAHPNKQESQHSQLLHWLLKSHRARHVPCQTPWFSRLLWKLPPSAPYASLAWVRDGICPQQPYVMSILYIAASILRLNGTPHSDISGRTKSCTTSRWVWVKHVDVIPHASHIQGLHKITETLQILYTFLY